VLGAFIPYSISTMSLQGRYSDFHFTIKKRRLKRKEPLAGV
jgi:hypothetical protein